MLCGIILITVSVSMPNTLALTSTTYNNGFEDGFNSWTSTSGSPSIVSSPVYSGSYAMESSNPYDTHATIAIDPQLPIFSQAVYLLDQELTSTEPISEGIMTYFDTDWAPLITLNLGSYGGTNRYLGVFAHQTSTYAEYDLTGIIETNTWYIFGLEATPTAYKIYFNNKLILNIEQTNIPEVAIVSVGMHWGSGYTGHIYVDEVQIGSLYTNPTPTSTFVPSPVPTVVPIPTLTPTPTNVPTPTATPTPTPSSSPTSTPTATPTPIPRPTPVSQPTGTNIVQNGGFDSGISPWTLEIYDPQSQGYAGTLTQSSSAYSGRYSGLFTVTGNPLGGSGYITALQTLPAQVGQTYTLQLYYKGNMAVWPHVFCFGSSWNLLELFTGPALSPTSSWTLMTMTFLVTSGTARTQIHFDVGSTGTFQVDNVTVIPASSPSYLPDPTATSTPTPSPTPSSSPQMLIGIYSDQASTVPLSSYNWGALSAGTTSTLVIYVQNQGNTAVTLSRELSSFNPPSLSSYLTLNWDYSGQALNQGDTLKITLTLIVSPSTPAMANFGFNATITAHESVGIVLARAQMGLL